MFIKAYGCSYSRYEAQGAERRLAAMGYDVYLQGVCSDRELFRTPAEEGLLRKADAVILNTCTLTDYHEKDILHPAIARARASNPRARVFLTGCCLRNERSWLRESEAAAFLKWEDLEQTFAHPGPRRKGDILSNPDPVVLVKAACDNNCSYCVCGMKKTRENPRSYSGIKAEMQALARQGHKSMSLAGPCYGAWTDGQAKKKFSDLLAAAFSRGLQVRGLELHPDDLDIDVLDLLDEYRSLVGEVSVPVQHASDRILRKMNRGYGRSRLDEIFRRLDGMTGLLVTTDVIVGFPGETRADLRELGDFVCRHRLHRVDCYSFSFRAGSPLAGKAPRPRAAAIRGKVAKLRAAVVGRFGSAGFNDTTRSR